MRAFSFLPGRRLAALTFALAALGLAPACKQADRSGPIETTSYTEAAPSPASAPAPGVAMDEAAEARERLDVAPAPPDTAGTGAASAASPSAAQRAPMLVRTGTMRVRVARLDAARRAVLAAAERFGGYVGNESERSAGGGALAEITVRVPAARYAALVDTLAALGTVEERATQVEDVTRAYADLGARTATKLATEQRYRELLARANSVEDVLKVEAQLGQIREEIEGAQAQLRTMRDQAALSTLTVTLATTSSGGSTTGPSFLTRLADALRDGASLLSGLVLGLVRLWGLWLLLALGVAAWRRWGRGRWRLRRRAPSTGSAAAGPGATGPTVPPAPNDRAKI